MHIYREFKAFTTLYPAVNFQGPNSRKVWNEPGRDAEKQTFRCEKINII